MKTIQSSSSLCAAVMDISLPEDRYQSSVADHYANHGFNLARALKLRIPDAGVVMFSAYEDRLSQFTSLVDEGLRGLVYQLKGSSGEELLEAVRFATQGGIRIDPRVVRGSLREKLLAQFADPYTRQIIEYCVSHLPSLTKREMEVAQKIAECKDKKIIAAELGMALPTVHTHLGHIYSKTGIEQFLTLTPETVLAKAVWVYELSAMHDGTPRAP
jgi:DNA-binding NarL/FixJ family response regulator